MRVCKAFTNCNILQLDGDIAEQKGGRFSSPLSVPQLKEALEKAAYDPRIRGIHLKIGSVSAGWAKLQVGSIGTTLWRLMQVSHLGGIMACGSLSC